MPLKRKLKGIRNLGGYINKGDGTEFKQTPFQRNCKLSNQIVFLFSTDTLVGLF